MLSIIIYLDTYLISRSEEYFLTYKIDSRLFIFINKTDLWKKIFSCLDLGILSNCSLKTANLT